MDAREVGIASPCQTVTLTLIDSQRGLCIRKHHMIGVGVAAVFIGVVFIGKEFGVGMILSTTFTKLIEVLADKGVVEA